MNPTLELTLYALFIVAILMSLFAQIKVSSTFRKYSRIPAPFGKTGAEIARKILSDNGIYDVRIERVGGNLTDHYDPRGRVLRLSDAVYSSSSTAAVGVAAHEAGHAVQHEVGYLPLKLRGALVPITGFASRSAWIIIMLGLFISIFSMSAGVGYYVSMFGVALFSVTAIFQLVTLPCEFNASKRALSALRETGYYSGAELRESRKVLTAAALTYVAALFVTVIQLLRLFLLVSRRRDR